MAVKLLIDCTDGRAPVGFYLNGELVEPENGIINEYIITEDSKVQAKLVKGQEFTLNGKDVSINGPIEMSVDAREYPEITIGWTLPTRSILTTDITINIINVPLELDPFLTKIANAIRTKKGTTGLIKATNFASEIESIESGGGLVGYSPNVNYMYASEFYGGILADGTYTETLSADNKYIYVLMLTAGHGYDGEYFEYVFEKNPVTLLKPTAENWYCFMSSIGGGGGVE